jgi:hypothetical protein
MQVKGGRLEEPSQNILQDGRVMSLRNLSTQMVLDVSMINSQDYRQCGHMHGSVESLLAERTKDR